ncbi:MAG: ABC transporter ATP-binding protein/permease [Spiroplasma ixodetis]|nr:ABC transporter ATP-binding protein/permease [Spiroplasma ixodetis]MBP1527241.1 ABC transporter ATP-binding protein/permease [Spiroplasma ixodetis]MBP1528439.1 ABC transporter ATP-binding protein/permease [Spiroplasma ixodetis]
MKTNLTETTHEKRVKNSDFLINATDIVKVYGDKTVLNKLNIQIKAGERIGIIGANGSGKSTLTEIIAGIRHATSGVIEKKEGIVIGFQFQESKYPPGITVMDMLTYYLETFNIEINVGQLNELLNTYQLSAAKNKNIMFLSGGQQQRLNILLSVIHKPDLVILDEVSTGLDIEVKEEIFDFLQKNIVEKNVAMILVTHNMSEIEHFCTRIIYMHDGDIIEKRTVKEVVKEYGSVHNYTSQQFQKYKKPTIAAEKKALSKKKGQQDPNKIVNAAKTRPSKQIPLLNLMFKYYLKGFFVPFFLIVYPILILGIQGESIRHTGADVAGTITAVKQMIAGIAIVNIISVGIFIIPQTIIEFKLSVLLKRIGATNIHPLFFVTAVIIIGVFASIISFLWTLLWGGIYFGGTYSWSVIALPTQIGASIPWIIIIFITTIGLGIMLASLFKTITSFIAVANVLYLPVAYLSGSIMPIDWITSSKVLNIISYFSPFKYSTLPYFECWNGTFKMTWEMYLYGGISLIILAIFMGIAARKLKWQD